MTLWLNLFESNNNNKKKKMYELLREINIITFLMNKSVLYIIKVNIL